MKRISTELWFVTAALGFLLSWLIDRLGGPVSISVGSPVAFLTSTILLHKYPFTATAIIIRSLAIFITIMLGFSLINRKYFTKAIIIFFVGLLAEFYAIQQLTTGGHLTTIQWTLSIAYGSFTLVLGIAWMILKGIWSTFNKEAPKDESEHKTSVLEPPLEK